MNIVVIDDDGPSWQSCLTSEQRDRIQRQRQLALAKRKARVLPSLAPPGLGGPDVINLCDSDEDYSKPYLPPNKRLHSSVESKRSPAKVGTSASPVVQVPASVHDPVPAKPGLAKKEVVLSDEQLMVLEAVAAKKSVFVTGSAGTGKSFIIEHALQRLRTLYPPSTVYVTASTGLAACALNGTTLHSFAGVGLGAQKKEVLVDIVSSRREKVQRWLTANALVVDEISMVDAELFEKIDYVGRCIRKCSKPFGGIQLLVTGDFFQLPPVQGSGWTKQFAFKARCWDECFDLQMELTHVFRQPDSEFVDMLNEIRRGRCSSATYCRLLACTNPSTGLGIELTKLYPRRCDVDVENVDKLRALEKETVTFRARDSGRVEMLKSTQAEAVVTLAVGAQVMLVKNIDQVLGLVNGARGVVVKFVPAEEKSRDVLPVVQFTDGMETVIDREKWSILDGAVEVASRVQVPLVLAWALSVHKCQGMTLDRVQTDLSRSFEYGMVYVALSRVRSLDGLKLLGFDPKKIKVHPEVVEFYERLKVTDKQQQQQQLVP